MNTEFKREQNIYLYDYAKIMKMSFENPDIDIYSLFIKYMIDLGRHDCANPDYFQKMVIYYGYYNLFRAFSTIEDFLLNRDDFISNNELIGIKQNIRIKTAGNISEKRLVKLIRNGFNHDDDDSFEKMTILPNNKGIKIRFKDLRTPKEKSNSSSAEKPATIVFSFQYLYDLMETLGEKAQNILLFTYTFPEQMGRIDSEKKLIKAFKNAKFKLVHFKKKIPFDKISVLKLSTDSMEKERIIDEIEDKEFEEFYLDKSQRIKLESLLKDRFGRGEDYRNILYGYTDNSFLDNIIPFPLLKRREFLQQAFFADHLFSSGLSLNRIKSILYECYTNENRDDCETEKEKLLRDYILQSYSKDEMVSLLHGIDSKDFMINYPRITYIDSVVTKCIDEDTLIIDSESYSKESLRDAFTHSRWYLSDNDELVMYNADPININALKLEYIGTIKLDRFDEFMFDYIQGREFKRLDELRNQNQSPLMRPDKRAFYINVGPKRIMEGVNRAERRRRRKIEREGNVEFF